MEGQVRCPVCRKLRPAELVTAFCTAQAAYKVALLGSRDNTVKALSDMRRNPKNVLNRVASVRVPPDCVCPFLEWKRGKLLVLSLHPHSSSSRSQSRRRPLQVSAVSHVTSLYKRQGRLLERVKRTGKCERIP